MLAEATVRATGTPNADDSLRLIVCLFVDERH